MARREADTLLKAYIARNLFDDEGFYPIYAPMDEVLQKALEELKAINLTDRWGFLFVEHNGVEPMTSCMPCKRSSQLS